MPKRAQVLRIEPSWTIEGVQAKLSNFKHKHEAELFFTSLRRPDCQKNSAPRFSKSRRAR